MEIKDADMLNNDYDWFVIINHRPIHVASDGTLLPKFIARNFDNQIYARKLISKLPIVVKGPNNILINPNIPRFTGLYEYAIEYNIILEAYDEYKGGQDDKDKAKFNSLYSVFNFDQEYEDVNNIVKLREYLARIYVPEFLKFGEKGFLSFDHTINKEDKDTFHWVVNPQIEMTVEIQDLNLPSIELNGLDSFENLLSDSFDIVSLVDKYLK